LKRIVFPWLWSTAIQIGLCAAVIFALWQIDDRALLQPLVVPVALRGGPVIIQELAEYARFTLAYYTAEIVIVSIFCSTAWLATAALRRPDRPGMARDSRLGWGIILAIGFIAAMAAVGLTLWSNIVHDLLGVAASGDWTDIDPLVRIVLIASSAGYLIFSYLFIGTLFTTPAAMKPAVPLATMLRRG